MDFSNFLIEVGDGDGRDSAQGHTFQSSEPPNSQGTVGARGTSNPPKSVATAMPMAMRGPGQSCRPQRTTQHSDCQAHSGEGNAQGRFGRRDPEVRGHEWKYGLRGVQLREGRNPPGKRQSGQDATITAGTFDVSLPGVGAGLGGCFAHRARLGWVDTMFQCIGHLGLMQ